MTTTLRRVLSWYPTRPLQPLDKLYGVEPGWGRDMLFGEGEHRGKFTLELKIEGFVPIHRGIQVGQHIRSVQWHFDGRKTRHHAALRRDGGVNA